MQTTVAEPEEAREDWLISPGISFAEARAEWEEDFDAFDDRDESIRAVLIV